MDYVLLFMGSLIVNIALGMVIAFTGSAIINRFKFMWAKFVKLGLARMLGNDNRIRIYLRDLRGRDLDIRGGKYLVNSEAIVYEDGVPTLNYKEGELQPINLKDHKVEQEVDSDQLSDLIIRSYSLGKASANKRQEILMYLMVASVTFSAISVAMLYKLVQVIVK